MVLAQNLLNFLHIVTFSLPLSHTENEPFHPSTQYWVPRIRLYFFAEDPRVFVERLQFALNLRKQTEALITFNRQTDCMPIWSGGPFLETQSLQRMQKFALSTPGLRQAT